MKWKITDNGSGASMVVQGDEAPDQDDAEELFQSDQGRRVVQQFKTQKKAELRQKMGPVEQTSTWGQLFSSQTETDRTVTEEARSEVATQKRLADEAAAKPTAQPAEKKTKEQLLSEKAALEKGGKETVLGGGGWWVDPADEATTLGEFVSAQFEPSAEQKDKMDAAAIARERLDKAGVSPAQRGAQSEAITRKYDALIEMASESRPENVPALQAAKERELANVGTMTMDVTTSPQLPKVSSQDVTQVTGLKGRAADAVATLQQGIAGAGEGLLEPEGMLMTGPGLAAGLARGAEKAALQTTEKIFAKSMLPQMAVELPKHIGEAAGAYSAGDTATGDRAVANAMMTGIMLGAAGHEAVKGETVGFPERDRTRGLGASQRDIDAVNKALADARRESAPETSKALEEQKTKGEDYAQRVRSDKEELPQPGQEPKEGEGTGGTDVSETTPREGEGTPSQEAVDLERREGEDIAKEGGEPEKITSSAYVKPDGDVEYGANHPEILDRLGVSGFDERESRNTPDFGFRTNKRPFITRQEATRVANRSGQTIGEPKPEGHQLHSDEVAHPTETGKALGEVPQPAAAPALDPFERFLERAIHATDPLRGGRTLEGVTGAPVWLTKTAANGALRAVRMAYRTAKDVAKALDAGVKWMRQAGLKGFDEREALAFLDAMSPASQEQNFNKRLGTRAPSAVSATEHAVRDQTSIDLASFLRSGKAPEAAELIKKHYPYIKLGKTPEETLENFINHIRDNLLWLHDKYPEEYRRRAKLWYDGARALAVRWSHQYGLPRESVAAVIALLSPQRDWYQNVELARRVISIYKNPPNGGRWTPEMDGIVLAWIHRTQEKYGKGKALGPDARKYLDDSLLTLRNTPFDQLENSRLQAVWIRAYSTAHMPNRFNVWSPEGHEMGPSMTKEQVNEKGKVVKASRPAGLSWGQFSFIARALDAIKDPSLDNLSYLLGEEHKIRNFYNNVLNPNEPKFGDITADTHAVAAGQLLPLGGDDLEVRHNLGGGVSSDVHGISGIYALYAEAYRRAAKERGLLPREMQSITWEAGRGLFAPEFKSQEANVDLVKGIWARYTKGEISIDEARDQILKEAGGIDAPPWAERPTGAGDAATQHPSDAGQLPRPVQPDGRPDGGGGSGLPAAEAAPGVLPETSGAGGEAVPEWARTYPPEGRPDLAEHLLNKAIEATRPGTKWTGRTALGIGQVPVWLAQEAAHGALRAVRAAYRTSKDIGKAVQAGVDWMREQNLRGFKEDDARKWLSSALAPQGPVNPEQTHGIAARVSAQAAAEGVIPPITPGTGVQAEAMVRRGQALLKAGADPHAIAENFRQTGRLSEDDLSVSRAHSENLRRTARDIGEEDGPNSPLYKAAQQADFDWLQDVYKPMQTAWHAMGEAQQGEVELDTGSFHGLNRQHMEDTGGREIPEKKVPQAEKIAAENKKAKESTGKTAKELNGHMTDVTNEVKRISKEQEAGWKKVRDEAVKLADLENQRRIAQTPDVRKALDDQAKAAKRAMDAVWKVHRDHAARIAKNETAARVLEAQRQREIYDIQEEASRKAQDAAAQQARDAAVAAANAENKARVVDAQLKAELAQVDRERERRVKETTDKVTRAAAVRAAEAERKAREAKAKANKELAKIEADRQRKAAEAAAKRARDIAAERAKRTREMQANPDLRVWNQARVYLDQGLDNFDEIRNKVATDLGLSVDQVTRWLAYDKRAKFLADELWKKQYAERLLKNKAKRFLTNLEVPTWEKAAAGVQRGLFNLKVGVHGLVALGTHAPMVFYQANRWAQFFENFGRMYRMVGRPEPWGQAAAKAYYERQVQDLVRRKNYVTAQRAGLINDPYDHQDFNSEQTSGFWNNMLQMGNRGYSTLKFLRQDLFDQQWDKLPRTQQIPEVAEAIADGINHTTGVVGKLPGSRHLSTALFAPKLLASRAMWLVGDTVRAGRAMANWGNADLGEQKFAMNYLKERLWVMGTYASLLAANQGFLSMMGSNQKVNFTDPLKSDWMKFKVAGQTVSFGNAMLTMVRLPARLWIAIANQGKLNKLMYPDENVYSVMGDYVRSQMSPLAGTATDLALGADYARRPLPRKVFGLMEGSENMPKRLRAEGVKPYTWPEYTAETLSMIPIEEAIRDVWGHGGMPPETWKDATTAMFWATFNPKSLLMVGTGARVSEDYEAKQRTEEEAAAKELQAQHQRAGALY